MIPKPCIDRVLPKDLWHYQSLVSRPGGRLSAVAPIGKAWINGSTLRVRFIGGSEAQKAIVKEQAGWWSAVANLKFDFNDAPDAEIRISFNSNDGAWSYIGTDCRQIPFDHPTMNLGFLNGGTAAHEWGHALSLGHEHSNPAGGIQWNEPVVIKELSEFPNFWTEPMVRHNVFSKYAADQINGTAHDSDSIMLYWFPREWTLNGIETKANEVLSATDKSFISGARMYPKTPPSPIFPELVVDGQKQAANIGKFGEEDLFRFQAPRNDRYIIETHGYTDLVMKLFGPSSQTALIAEDDDSGLGLNSRIIASLIAGEYFIQVRHWNRLKGTGQYSIGVRRK